MGDYSWIEDAGSWIEAADDWIAAGPEIGPGAKLAVTPMSVDRLGRAAHREEEELAVLL